MSTARRQGTVDKVRPPVMTPKTKTTKAKKSEVEDKPKTPDLFVTEAAKTTLKQFTWKIKGFQRALVNGLFSFRAPITLEFDIGEALGLASTWSLILALENDVPLRNTIVLLGAARTAGTPEAKYFDCHAWISKEPSRKAKLSNVTAVQEFGEFGQLLDAMVGEELDIQVQFALYSNGASAPGTDALTLPGGANLLEKYGKLFQSGDNSDFVIMVKEADGSCAEIKVHKAILGAQFAFFQTMLDSGMTEVANGTWTIEDLSPACVKIMLQFIYSGCLEDGWKSVGDELVQAADKYDLPILLKFLDRNLHSACTIENAMKLRRVAKLHKLELATKNIRMFIMSDFDGIVD